MRTAADIYSAASALGMLSTAVWNGATRVDGDFRAASRDAFGVITTGPVFSCPVDCLPNAAQGDTLDVCDIRYKVVNMDRDGLGAMTLQLQKE